MVMIEGMLITAGITLSYWVNYGMSFIGEKEVAWRFPIAFQILFAVVIFLSIMHLPESPRWLVMQGRDDEALDVLECLNEKSRDDPSIQNELLSIKETVKEMSKGSYRSLFDMSEYREFHRVALAYINQMFQQISGINLITYYAPSLYAEIGLGQGSLPKLLAACNGTEYLMAAFIPIFIIEKVGRRPLMLFGAAGMSISMAVLAGTNYRLKYLDDKQAGIGQAIFLFVFNTFFAIGWLGMTWLYPAEIVPLRIRAPTNALATSANWIFNFMVVMITPVAFDSIGYKTYIIFAVINAFIFPFVYFFFPETRYRSLEEMDAIFKKSTNVFNAVTISIKEPYRYDKHGELKPEYLEDALRRNNPDVHIAGTKFDSDESGAEIKA
ncbi:Major facilitator superfamily domain general substrate transporter [Penicillium soppii]|uniref:Major facilitator superfamily domain general substrate transporter n=1 Tax=Penicillium soppii TaxID=69789 RepID=UPI00254865CA|nr:Major facilitator superfamily domain general substrate transporter [Penicillium soppii]KAJ5876029.1 Major facilitator superfamily domain general substrate transporter [Penicillium soppii]